MGRRRVPLELVKNDKARNNTFLKRKNGLFKKVMELSILCDCEIGIVMFNHNGKLVEYSSGGVERLPDLVRRWGEYTGPSESKSNRTALQSASGNAEQRHPRWTVQPLQPPGSSGSNAAAGGRAAGRRRPHPSMPAAPGDGEWETARERILLSSQLGLMNDPSLYTHIDPDTMAAYEAVQRAYAEQEMAHGAAAAAAVGGLAADTHTSSPPQATEASGQSADTGDTGRSPGSQHKRHRPSDLRVSIPAYGAGMPPLPPNTDTPSGDAVHGLAEAALALESAREGGGGGGPPASMGAPGGSGGGGGAPSEINQRFWPWLLPPSSAVPTPAGNNHGGNGGGVDWSSLYASPYVNTPAGAFMSGALPPASTGNAVHPSAVRGLMTSPRNLPRGASNHRPPVMLAATPTTANNNNNNNQTYNGGAAGMPSQMPYDPAMLHPGYATIPMRVHAGLLSPSSFLHDPSGLMATPRDSVGAGGLGGGWFPYIGTGNTPRFGPAMTTGNAVATSPPLQQPSRAASAPAPPATAVPETASVAEAPAAAPEPVAAAPAIDTAGEPTV